MTQDETTTEAVSLLQDLGLQEYEARCFVALNKLPSGTAKKIHELSEVPRTRVYDAIRVLESQGLVEVQHSSPQLYRAVGIDEATQILRRRYSDRIDTLETYLENAEVKETDDVDHVQEVWSLTGHDAIESRTLELIAGAESEVALLVIDEGILSEDLFDTVQTASNENVSIVLGGQDESITETLEVELPDSHIFRTDLTWLTGTEHDDDEVAISRILLVDRETLLVGSYYPNGAGEPKEQAIFARGLQNGVVVLLRRLLTAGLSVTDDTAG